MQCDWACLIKTHVIGPRGVRYVAVLYNRPYPMLQLNTDDARVPVYQSPLLLETGVRHGFSTRVGGVSEGPYAWLNLDRLEKNADKDGNTHIAENFRRLRRALNMHQLMRIDVRQVHGGDVWQPPAKALRPMHAPCADALVTNYPRHMLTIRTADCVPLLLASRCGRHVAAIHAGWRGIVANVIPATIEKMRTCYDIAAGDIVAAIGPCLSVEHFEVGEEVVTAFIDAGLTRTIRPPKTAPRSKGATNAGKAHIDLQQAAYTQLMQAGLPDHQVDGHTCCTWRDEHLFFSHRRDAGITGRMAAVIAVR